MATIAASADKRVKEYVYAWEGRDKSGKLIKGEMRASGEALVSATLRRQGINVIKVRRQRSRIGKKITEKDIALFTRQLATMMKAGVPLLQAFDIVARGHANPAVTKLLNEIRTEVETGSALHQAFRKHPVYFDQLFCNLVEAGEAAGILDNLLDRLATYKEKILAVKGKIKSALFYPLSIIVVAFIITAVIMIFVIPAFKELFTSFGADLPTPTLVVISISNFFVDWWWAIFGGIGFTIWFFFFTWKRSLKMQQALDRLFLRLPVFGEVIRKATIARWARTLSTMFAAGVPLVEALDSVGGASGNYVYWEATKQIQAEVSTGPALPWPCRTPTSSPAW
ncbi:MAG: type II secretion system protein F [Burkholderiales bacterium]|nr:MAG: type II secretion system protein F [Burkholderiales bacterium]